MQRNANKRTNITPTIYACHERYAIFGDTWSGWSDVEGAAVEDVEEVIRPVRVVWCRVVEVGAASVIPT